MTIKYTDETKQFVQITNHTFEAEIEVINQTVPVGHRLWFEYELDKLAEAGGIEEYQGPQSTLPELIDSIDTTAATITTKWTRFSQEYAEREKAALEFKASDYKGEADIYITSFSKAAGITNQQAAELILSQAEKLRGAQTALGALRMRKFELQQPDLTAEQMQQIHDDIISKMQAIAASYD